MSKKGEHPSTQKLYEVVNLWLFNWKFVCLCWLILDYIGYENQMNGGSYGVLMFQTCKNWQLEFLVKLLPLLDVSVVGVYLTKYILTCDWDIGN